MTGTSKGDSSRDAAVEQDVVVVVGHLKVNRGPFLLLNCNGQLSLSFPLSAAVSVVSLLFIDREVGGRTPFTVD